MSFKVKKDLFDKRKHRKFGVSLNDVLKDPVCGGELEPTLGEVHAYLYATDPEFMAFVDEEHRKLEVKR